MTLARLLLGRTGDILGVLPALKWLAEHGERISFVTHWKYSHLANGLHHRLDVVATDYELEQAQEAADFYRSLADQLRIIQLPYTSFVPAHENFQLAQWARTGAPMELFHQLPLDLPRNRMAERLIARQYRKTSKPLILVNTTGVASPFAEGDQIKQFIRDSFAEAEVLDIGTIHGVYCFQDLLGLYEQAACIISIDTATLALGYAAMTPTIALVNDDPWSASAARSHWRLRVPYRDVMKRKDDIAYSVGLCLN